MIEHVIEGLDERIQVRVSPKEKKEIYEFFGNDPKKVARFLRWSFVQGFEILKKEKEIQEQKVS